MKACLYQHHVRINMSPGNIVTQTAPANACDYCHKNGISNVIQCINCSLFHHKRCSVKKKNKFCDCESKVVCCAANDNGDDDVSKDSIAFTAEAFVELKTRVKFLYKLLEEIDVVISDKVQIIND
ncbi:hypothetical protein HHI36_001535 [Cryptolaemus montrouzieri]|uniref:Phorbol-ester/DAG-type domain-containing protein n=1 Tax=Cryptolaemus montrouzieri TaxID=559131 RepID=A0ABD2P883_9CUCU